MLNSARILSFVFLFSPIFSFAQSGCMDSLACNYDSTATEDDGSCCYANCISIDMGEIITLEGITWQLVDEAGEEVASGGVPFNVDLCLETGCYDIIVTDANGMEFNVLLINVLDENGDSLLDFSWDIDTDLSFDFSFCIPEICDGPDFNCDLVVGTADLIYFLAEIGCDEGCTCDFTGDGEVLTDDLMIFLSSFGI